METNYEISRYLSKPSHQGDFIIASAYMNALIDARISTGRDKDTGKISNQNLTHSWAGNLVYLVLMEHIGNLFRKHNEPNINGGSFIRTLKYFTGLEEEEIYTLYALRCSFAHEYFLFNIPNKNIKEKNLLTHHFLMTINNDEPLIKIPSKKWNGSFMEMNDTVTVINLKKLGDLVENIHLKLLELNKNNNLEIIPGKEELLSMNNVIYSI